MRILIWSEFFWPHIGGIEVRVGQLAAALCRQGHDVLVITERLSSDLPARECWRGMTICRMDTARTFDSRDLRRVHRFCAEVRELKRSYRPEVELVYASGTNVVVRQMASHGLEVPTITSIQAPPESVVQAGGSVARLLHDSAAVLAVSENVRRGLCETMPELAGRVLLLRNCLPMPELAPAPLVMDPPVILCLGRLAPEKGFDLALRALAQLDGRWSQVRMIVAGEGAERPALEALAGELGVAPRVTFTGWVEPSAVPDLFNRATLLVMPARWHEPFGLVNLQAAQMARPVVASRMGANPEVIVEGETGLLVENEDSAGLAAAIETLLADPARMEAMGARARKRAMAQFGFDAYLARHLELFRQYTVPFGSSS